MNAPPFPLNPAVGEWFQNWTWNGSRWVCSRASGIRVLTTTFLANAPYQPAPGLVSLIAECWGGGGGGGQVVNATATTVLGCSGGTSGMYCRKTLPAALVAGGVMVTIGQGGAGVWLGHTSGEFDGLSAPGGSTSFGAFCLAPGGYGGSMGGSSVAPPPSVPDQPQPVGDVMVAGFAGSFGTTDAGTNNAWGGPGAGPGGGQGFLANNAAYPGEDAFGTSGAGGGGAVCSLTAGTYNGGAGAPGMCVVTEYCWADAASDGSDCFNPQTVNLNARLELERTGWPPGPGPGQRPPGPFGGDDYEG